MESDGQQGNWHTYGKLVTITKNWQTWQNFNWTEKNQKGSILNNTYQAKGIYYHFNGSRYLSLYDKYGKWHGYINENATKTVQNEQGNWHKYGKYVTIKENNYKLWSNFDWKKKNISNKLINQTFEARGIYHHLNGSRYLSLYDKNGKWLGYINENATKLGDSKQGVYNSYGKYITITKNNYKLWQNFGWKQKNTSSNILNQTFQARGIYYHLNGRRYLSLFDNNSTWMGYINANATKIADGKQGIYHSYGKRVTITSNNYPIWRGFSWKTKANGNHKNKTYQAKGIYYHMNGSSYLSIYDGNKWIGYINQKGTQSAGGVGAYMGTTRQKVINTLLKDERAAKNKKRYLGTPFGGFSVMVPQVRSNCTGFVALAMRDSGGKLNKITSITNGYGGAANAYNWRDALKKNTDYSTFNSISQLLKSGKARKGDIIYFESDFSKPNPDCHIGIFWGNTASENRIWHSTGAYGNNITHLFSGTPYSKIYLFPMD